MKKIIVTGHPKTGYKEIYNLLKPLLANHENIKLEKVVYKDEILLEDEAAFIFVYCAPEIAINNILGKQPVNQQALETSSAQLRQTYSKILWFYYRNQERCFLLNPEAISNNEADLINQLNTQFNIKLSHEHLSFVPEEERFSSVGAVLTHFLLEDHARPIQAIYDELESIAHIPAIHDNMGFETKSAAYKAYQDLQHQLAHQTAEIQRLEENTNHTQKIEQIQQQYQEQIKKNEEQTQENKLLELQLHQIQEELEHYLSERQKIETQKAQETNHLKKIEEIQQQYQEQIKKNEEQAQENQLLELQLHQIQEELEHYFTKSKQLSVPRISGLAEYVIDFRDEVNGTSWYYAEKMGRWAGPLSISTLKIPSLGAGSFVIELHVNSTLDLNILREMQLNINGKPCTISQDWKKLPARIHAEFSTSSTDTQQQWELEFKFPKTITPSEVSDSDDERKITICMRSLRVSKKREHAKPLFLIYKDDIESDVKRYLKTKKITYKLNPFRLVKKVIR
ncbi:hypothetical protein [Legionella longbeachae]|uniref:hypothetical protein n=1 Tax=Legionella longbeachae TaxID=450 RepID=UPI0001BEC47A|nr:hypothetical protein [Legionella longbeachae]EEZ97002.1 hypothetical protein LLB_2203 [Legionella longbeachae D-4968]